LKVEATPEDLVEILEQTYKELSRKVKVPGFRQGKVPRQVIDSHLGPEYVRAEAVKNGLPTLYVMGVEDSGIMPVADPDINIIDVSDDGSVVFEAKVDVKPEVEVKDYKGLEVDRPDVSVADEDVQQALDEARDRFATLEVVEARPVQKGDFVMFDYKVFTDGVPLEGSQGMDRMTEIGADDFLPGFDEQLDGARKGDIIDVVVNFPPDYGERTLAGKPATFRTMVKEIKRKVLPELDDGLAKEISSFETLEEFKDDLRKRIAKVKEVMGERDIKQQVVQVLVDKTYVDVPESMIQHQVNLEIEDMTEELAQRGIGLDEYLEAMKGTRYQLEKAISERLVEGIKAELVIDAVASAENIEVTDEEAEDYIRESALQAGGDPEKIIEETRSHGRLSGVKSNRRLSRAVDVLVDNAVFKDGGAVADGVAPEAATEGETVILGAPEAVKEEGAPPEEIPTGEHQMVDSETASKTDTEESAADAASEEGPEE
jgi:trigger factor